MKSYVVINNKIDALHVLSGLMGRLGYQVAIARGFAAGTKGMYIGIVVNRVSALGGRGRSNWPGPGIIQICAMYV